MIDENSMKPLTVREEQIIEILTNKYADFEKRIKQLEDRVK